MVSARRAIASCRERGSWLSNTSDRTAPKVSPPRAMTDSTIACVIRMRETIGSGSAPMSRSNDACPHETNPSGAFLRLILFFFFGSSPALATARAFSMSCSGASATTSPSVS